MFELLKLFPRRPLVISAALWLLFFVIQIILLTAIASRRYVSAPDSPPFDGLWFVYTELPRALPMAAVYAVCMVFVAQILGSSIAASNPDNLTLREWSGLLKRNPVRAVTWIGIRVISLLALAFLIVNPGMPSSLSWIRTLSAVLLGSLLIPILFGPWITWIVEGVTSRDDNDAR